MEAICVTDCWDSAKCIYYEHGRTYEIDKANPLFRHFKPARKGTGEDKPDAVKTGKAEK